MYIYIYIACAYSCMCVHTCVPLHISNISWSLDVLEGSGHKYVIGLGAWCIWKIQACERIQCLMYYQVFIVQWFGGIMVTRGWRGWGIKAISMILSLSIEGSRHGPKALMPWRWRLQDQKVWWNTCCESQSKSQGFRAEVPKDWSSPEAIWIS